MKNYIKDDYHFYKGKGKDERGYTKSNLTPGGRKATGRLGETISCITNK